MFTGIIETIGKVLDISCEGTNIHYTIESGISNELKVDQSVAHDGVCLTVTEIPGLGLHKVTAIDETLQKTALRQWKKGTYINLERAMSIGSRLDGHIVQGHVDTTASLERVEDVSGSWNLFFRHEVSADYVTVSKGSVCVNGISLTVVESGDDFFSVSIIPYTWMHTNLRFLKIGEFVNVEFDILGKYISKVLSRYPIVKT